MLNKNFCKNLLFISFVIGILIIPVIACADADKIFKDNSKAVVVVVTLNEKGEPISQGSGFIVRADGAIVTNYHVISNAKDIKIKAGDKVLDVEGLIHTDKENDLVILKAKGEKLPIVKIGDIEKVNIGEKVYVISSPQGLENTISDGILSGKRERNVETKQGPSSLEEISKRKILQITAPISPGSSGGPVFNNNGEVIGIATFLIKEAQNLNFAMPVNLLKDRIESKKFTAFKKSEIEDYKKTAEYWIHRGYAFAETGLYDDAIKAYSIAIEINPNNEYAYGNRGDAYLFTKQFDKAINDYTKTISINPNISAAYNNRGFAYYVKRQYGTAIEDLTKAITFYPNRDQLYEYRGRAHIEMGNYGYAITDFQKACELGVEDMCEWLKKNVRRIE